MTLSSSKLSELMAGVDAHMDRVMSYIGTPDEFPTLTGYPFCGCDTCYWGEVITYLEPRILGLMPTPKVDFDKRTIKY